MRGLDDHGEPLHLQPRVAAGCARALWLGLALPSSAAAGDVLEVELQLTLDNPPHAAADAADAAPSAAATTVASSLSLRLAGARVDDLGDAQRWRLSRLRWLDSSLGHTQLPPAPFGPVSYVAGRGLRGAQTPDGAAAPGGGGDDGGGGGAPTSAGGGLVLTATMGAMAVDPGGLPSQLHAGRRAAASADDAAAGGVGGASGGGGSAGGGEGGGHGVPLLQSPLELVVTRKQPAAAAAPIAGGAPAGGAPATAAAAPPVRWRAGAGAQVERATADRVRWRAVSTSEDGSLRMEVRGEWSFDAQAVIAVELAAVGRDGVELQARSRPRVAPCLPPLAPAPRTRPGLCISAALTPPPPAPTPAGRGAAFASAPRGRPLPHGLRPRRSPPRRAHAAPVAVGRGPGQLHGLAGQRRGRRASWFAKRGRVPCREAAAHQARVVPSKAEAAPIEPTAWPGSKPWPLELASVGSHDE